MDISYFEDVEPFIPRLLNRAEGLRFLKLRNNSGGTYEYKAGSG